MTLQSQGTEPVDGDRVSRQIAELAPWFHDLHLPTGHQTAPDHPLGDFPSFKWQQIAPHIPEELHGARALDIGCNAGFYAFELGARGADVLALDIDEHYLNQARWAAGHLDPGSRIEFRRGSVYDLAELDERFDLVLFLGVLYHLRHPLLALDLVSEHVGDRLVLQTLTMPGQPPIEAPKNVPIDNRLALTGPGWPRAAFIEGELAGDPTNWWAPDDACIQAMIRSAGLRVVATPGHEIYVCETVPQDPARALRQRELRAALRC